MKKEIKVSVIVPVYNNAEYLDRCIDSLINQTIDSNIIEIILVNDGSTDNSLEICNAYAEKNKNIKVIDKKNGGVSSARNCGLDKATGKYCMFLDSDDYYSKETILNVSNYFDNHYDEVDIIAYNMTTVNEITKKEKRHYISKLFDENGIYDINENANLNHSTMNIIIKNNSERFDETMFFAEDEDFVIRLFMVKEKIGFCSEANYYYYKNFESVSNSKLNPYYSYQSILEFDEKLIDKFKSKDNKLPIIIQNYILKRMIFRIKSDNLFPYFLSDVEYNKFMSRLDNVLKYIEINTINDYKPEDLYIKFYILKLKNTKINLKEKDDNFILMSDNVEFYNNKEMMIRFTEVTYNKGVLNLAGYIKNPYTIFVQPNLYLCCKTTLGLKKKKLNIKVSNNSYYGTKCKIANFYSFETKINIDDIQKFYFEVKFHKNKYKCIYSFNNFTVFNNKYKSNKYFLKKHVLILNKDKSLFCIKKVKGISIIKLFHDIKISFLSSKKIMKKMKIFCFRILSKYNDNQKIWLYYDRNTVMDNAYYQFKNDISIDDGIKRFYIYDDEYENIKKYFTSDEEKYLIKHSSIKHKIIFLKTEKILTSFLPTTFYNPFKKSLNYYIDIYKAEVVYLQHGILHSHTPWIYSKDKNKISKIIISSTFEKNNLINNYNYNTEDLIVSGMPRFDFLEKEKKYKNIIVYAPSWRSSLIGNNDNQNRRKLYVEKFLASEFYVEIQKLINNKKFTDLLIDNKMIFSIRMHPIFKEYIYLFKNKCKNINFDLDVKIEDSCIFITDYSSFVFDYLWLKRPIIYFCPDNDKFKAGLHTYRKLDIPLEKGFGDIAYDAETLIEYINYYIKNNYDLKTKYKKRIDEFYIVKSNHCSKLYKELIKSEKIKED